MIFSQILDIQFCFVIDWVSSALSVQRLDMNSPLEPGGVSSGDTTEGNDSAFIRWVQGSTLIGSRRDSVNYLLGLSTQVWTILRILFFCCHGSLQLPTVQWEKKASLLKADHWPWTWQHLVRKQYNYVSVDKQRIKFLPEDPDLSHSQLWSWFTIPVQYPIFRQ